MARRRNIELGTGKLAALLLTLVLGVSACNGSPLGVMSGAALVEPTVGGVAVPDAQPLLQISAGAEDAGSVVVNYVRTFGNSEVELELRTDAGETVAVQSLDETSGRFGDLDEGVYRLLIIEQERIIDDGSGVALAGQRMVLSDAFAVSQGVAISIVCDDAGCTIS